MSFRGLIAILAVALIGIIGCSGDSSSDNNPTATPTPTNTPATGTPSPSPTGVHVGDRAADFSATDADGVMHTLHQYEGNVILLNLSAMWCIPCQEEAPLIENLWQTYRESGFVAISVLIEDYFGADPDAEDLNAWIQTYGLTYLVLGDSDHAVWFLYEGNNVPLNLVLDRDLVIRHRQEDFDLEAISAMIEDLL